MAFFLFLNYAADNKPIKVLVKMILKLVKATKQFLKLGHLSILKILAYLCIFANKHVCGSFISSHSDCIYRGTGLALC